MDQCQAIIKINGELLWRRGFGDYRQKIKKQCSRKAVENGLCKQHCKVFYLVGRVDGKPLNQEKL